MNGNNGNFSSDRERYTGNTTGSVARRNESLKGAEIKNKYKRNFILWLIFAFALIVILVFMFFSLKIKNITVVGNG